MSYHTGLMKCRPREHVADEVLMAYLASFNYKQDQGSQTGESDMRSRS